MRRTSIVPVMLAVALAVGACNSSTSAPRTVTFTNTVTGATGATGATGTGTAGSAGSVTVVPPSGSATGTAGSTAATKTTATRTGATTTAPSTTKSSAAPFEKVDPLSVSCALLLTQSDIKKALGATVPSGSIRVKDVADPERGVTGKARCRYGSTDGGKTGKVTVLLTTYNNAASAAKQVTLTRSSEEDLGATSSAATVRGYPARILLRDGGLIVLQYDTWTLSVVAADKLASADKLTTGLPLLAEQVLARILKNA